MVSTVFFIMAAVIITVSLYYGTATPENREEYSLTDQALVTYNQFCQSFVAKVFNTVKSNHSTLSLYLLSSLPILSEFENFNFSKSVQFIYNEYHNWSFKLNKGSKVNLSGCYGSTSFTFGIDFYLILDSKNYELWRNHPDQQTYTMYYHRFTSSLCYDLSFEVNETGLYYFTFYSYAFGFYISFDVNFEFNRSRYHIPVNTVVKHHVTSLDGHSLCQIDIPFQSHYTVVLALNTSAPVDYDEKAVILTHCHPRGWLYALTVICAMFPPILVVCIQIITTCVYFKIKSRKDGYEML